MEIGENLTEKDIHEYEELYQQMLPFMKGKSIPFDAFVFTVELLKNIKTEEDAMKLAKFLKHGTI